MDGQVAWGADQRNNKTLVATNVEMRELLAALPRPADQRDQPGGWHPAGRRRNQFESEPAHWIGYSGAGKPWPLKPCSARCRLRPGPHRRESLEKGAATHLHDDRVRFRSPSVIGDDDVGGVGQVRQQLRFAIKRAGQRPDWTPAVESAFPVAYRQSEVEALTSTRCLLALKPAHWGQCAPPANRNLPSVRACRAAQAPRRTLT